MPRRRSFEPLDLIDLTSGNVNLVVDCRWWGVPQFEHLDPVQTDQVDLFVGSVESCDFGDSFELDWVSELTK